MITIFQYTPLWVWVLFGFLIYRGIQALHFRQMSLLRMLVLPGIFFVWAILSIFAELQILWLGFTGFLAGLLFGFGIGWLICKNSVKAVTFDPATKLIGRPGSYWTYSLFMITSQG